MEPNQEITLELLFGKLKSKWRMIDISNSNFQYCSTWIHLIELKFRTLTNSTIKTFISYQGK